MVIKRDNSLSPFAAPTETRTTLRQALPQILAVSVKNVLLLAFGMTLGYPTLLVASLGGSHPDEDFSLGQEATSWTASMNLICVPVGCLFSGLATQPLGRKRAMQLVNIPFVTAWLLFYFSNDVWQIFMALALTGVSGGLLEAPVLTYVAEITQPSLRGILGSTSTVAVITGILIQFLLGTFFHWRTVALISCAAPIISLTLLMFVPESPHWLITKNRYLDARQSLAWLRGWTDLQEIETEFKELSEQISKILENTGPSCILYTKKNFWWPYSLVSFIFFLGHFSGMTTLQTYAVKIFSTLKAPINEYYATIFLGVAEVCGCILSACLVHYVGKRVMNFFSLIGCGTCFFVVSTYASLIGVKNFEIFPGNSDEIEYNWLPTTFLIGAAFFTHSGIRILPWMLIGEVYSTETRATASGLSGGLSYIFGFISNKIFLKMVSLISLPGTFWLYSGFCFGGTIILYFILPETEGKTLFEITEHFAGNTKLDNHVYRVKKNSTTGQVNQGFIAEPENPQVESKL